MATPTPEPTSKEVSTEQFELPVNLTVPGSWTRLFDEPRYVAAFRPQSAGSDAPLVGMDLGIVPNVYADPCRPEAGQLDPPLGPAASDLVDYLLSVEALVPSPAGDGTVDEAFVASADCPELLLWDGGSGNVFQEERKRFIVFDVGGQRVIAVIVAAEDAWDSVIAEATGVVESLVFNSSN